MEDQPPPLPVLFRPVPMQRARHDGWTPARQEPFLIYLEQFGIISAAACKRPSPATVQVRL